MILLTLFSFAATRNLKIVPGRLQSFAEIIVGGLHSLFQSILHDKTAVFFPVLATIFLFIINLNWIGLFPGVGTIGLEKIEAGHKAFVPIFRAGTADLNTTLALSLIVVTLIQYTGFASLGRGYLKKFFDISNPINFYVGILELISEFSKIISFAFRLFGNIFAGEVLLTVIAFLMPVFAPLPFIGLELFVGFIQALVFSMLTTVFLAVASTKGEH
jgi:F-type H+-transporting ATPase subunit a